MEKTLTIIKPDSMAKGNAGAIIDILIQNGFSLSGMRLLQLDEKTARAFYIEHEGKPFYDSLVDYMTSGPVIVAALEKEDAIKGLRALMGATNPQEAAEGTIRAKFGESIQNNAIHGSANPDDATREVAFFFSESELL